MVRRPAERPEYVERARRFAAREDGATGTGGHGTVPAGSAWWQWHTGCGDPHGIRDPGGTPEGTNWHYRRTTCPDGADHGVVPEWREIVGRPYPRRGPRPHLHGAGVGRFAGGGRSAPPGREFHQ